MKSTKLFLATAALLFGTSGIAAEKPVEKEPTLASTPETASPLRFTGTTNEYSDYAVLSIPPTPTNICFQTEKGVIKISLKDGSVQLPEGMKLDEASRLFWLTLADALPYVRHQLIYREEKKP